MSLTEMRIGDQTIRHDREATAAVYETVKQGEAEVCGCIFCKNFVAQRNLVYPASFGALLEQLGVDPNKEAEVFECGPVEDVTSMVVGFTSLEKWSHQASETSMLLTPTTSNSGLPPSAPMLQRFETGRG
jgi:hypothetical protein